MDHIDDYALWTPTNYDMEDQADPTLVPDFHWMDSDDWAVAKGYHHVRANYRLLVDNLLDLSHETFVHPETIGNDSVADSPVAVSIVDKKTVRAHRDMKNAEPPPQFVALAGMTEHIDRWHTTLYTPPGFCVIEVGAVPAGSADLARGFEARILNLITPETETSSHYFWGHARNIRRDDAALTDVIRDSIVTTFDQDKTVLEAQQIACEREGTFDPVVVLGIDAGPVQGRRLLNAHCRTGEAMKLVKVERNGRVAEGLLEGEEVHIVSGWIEEAAERVPFLLSQRPSDELRALRDMAQEVAPLASVTLVPPIDPTARIVCIGMNYRDHVGEIKID